MQEEGYVWEKIEKAEGAYKKRGEKYFVGLWKPLASDEI